MWSVLSREWYFSAISYVKKAYVCLPIWNMNEGEVIHLEMFYFFRFGYEHVVIFYDLFYAQKKL